MSHAKRDTEATPANAPDLDEETIEQIREMFRMNVFSTVIEMDEYGNFTIDMVPGDDSDE